jgi:DNA-binding HxlR family transcriptional regulator
VRAYDQYCPVACALDVIGDRWTLLVLRELTFGPQRFTDLRRTLVGIPPRLLVERLETLQEQGLVERREVPDAPARHVYALTPAGEDIREPMRALSRFGARYLPEQTPTGVRPRAALSALLLAYTAPVPEAAGARWRIVLEGQPFDIAVDARGVPRLVADVADEPDEVLTVTVAELAELRRAHRPVRSETDAPIVRAFALSRPRDESYVPAPA